MIKTYNMVHYHLGDNLAELVVSYIMPKHLLWDHIINSGSGEMVAMLHPKDYSAAYMHLAGDNEIELAKVVLHMDGGKSITDEDVEMHTQQGLENELWKAVNAKDIEHTKAAILAGARKFEYILQRLNYDARHTSAKLVEYCATIWWDGDPNNHDDVIIRACKNW